MTREEMLKAIATTSGFAGIQEFEYCESIHDMNRFIDWYKENISFCSQAGKELGANVIAKLRAGNKKHTVLRISRYIDK